MDDPVSHQPTLEAPDESETRAFGASEVRRRLQDLVGSAGAVAGKVAAGHGVSAAQARLILALADHPAGLSYRELAAQTGVCASSLHWPVASLREVLVSDRRRRGRAVVLRLSMAGVATADQLRLARDVLEGSVATMSASKIVRLGHLLRELEAALADRENRVLAGLADGPALPERIGDADAPIRDFNFLTPVCDGAALH